MSIGEVIDFSSLDQDIRDILSEAAMFRERSYSPYSHFKVGASLLCTDGTSFGGCNLENAAYPVGICAERSALAKAISEGKKTFRALAVVADQEDAPFISPCGMCRQAIAEFGNMQVYLAKSSMQSVLRTTISDLLPLTFSLL